MNVTWSLQLLEEDCEFEIQLLQFKFTSDSFEFSAASY